jgi:hypothetical protein
MHFQPSHRTHVALSHHGVALVVQRGEAVWGYLRTSLVCAGRSDLLAALDEKDLEQLQKALPL